MKRLVMRMSLDCIEGLYCGLIFAALMAFFFLEIHLTAKQLLHIYAIAMLSGLIIGALVSVIFFKLPQKVTYRFNFINEKINYLEFFIVLVLVMLLVAIVGYFHLY